MTLEPCATGGCSAQTLSLVEQRAQAHEQLCSFHTERGDYAAALKHVPREECTEPQQILETCLTSIQLCAAGGPGESRRKAPASGIRTVLRLKRGKKGNNTVMITDAWRYPRRSGDVLASASCGLLPLCPNVLRTSWKSVFRHDKCTYTDQDSVMMCNM